MLEGRINPFKQNQMHSITFSWGVWSAPTNSGAEHERGPGNAPRYTEVVLKLVFFVEKSTHTRSKVENKYRNW